MLSCLEEKGVCGIKISFEVIHLQTFFVPLPVTFLFLHIVEFFPLHLNRVWVLMSTSENFYLTFMCNELYKHYFLFHFTDVMTLSLFFFCSAFKLFIFYYRPFLINMLIITCRSTLGLEISFLGCIR